MGEAKQNIHRYGLTLDRMGESNGNGDNVQAHIGPLERNERTRAVPTQQRLDMLISEQRSSRLGERRVNSIVSS